MAVSDVAAVMDAGVRELEVMQYAVNYHRWMFNVIEPFIGQRVVEVGGGLGSISQFMVNRERLIILDYNAQCVAYLQNLFAQQHNVSVHQGDILDPQVPLTLQDEAIDTVVCTNVLEHIEDDVTALQHMVEMLQPEGRLILLVPAHPQLYGTLDTLVGHYRRYTRDDAQIKVMDAGLRVTHFSYFNSLGAVGRFFIGRVRNQQETGIGQVTFFDRYVVPGLSRLERVVSPPFGQSLIVVGQKE